MGRFYCDYCGMYTHSSPTSRKQHRYGLKHRENFQKYYERIREDQKRKFFEEHGIQVPPPGLPPPMLFSFPPPSLAGAVAAVTAAGIVEVQSRTDAA